MACDEFRVGELTAIIGDNEEMGEHRAGYNGVYLLASEHEENNLFVPRYAGLNLEHIFDGHTFDHDLLFEPRRAPMYFTKIDEATAQLHQPATPHFQLESITTFTLREPYYLDFHFECMAHEDVFRNGWIGLFWASYINAPLDKSLYFRWRRRWIQLCTQAHNDESTVLPDLEGETMPVFSDDYPPMLYTQESPLRFDEPFYYGRFHGMVYLLLFEEMEGVRFSHSPSGGGDSPDAETTNPAWDFQYLIPNARVGERYTFRARVVYKRFEGRDDVLSEVEKWRELIRP